ncbi:MAG: protein kinase [Acidobacteriota bacterium]
MLVADLAHFEVVERIGDGGMGVVYRARDRTLGRTVALKVLLPELNDDAERRSRFLREARAAASLNHPNIATLYEIGETAIDEETARRLGLDARVTVSRLPYIAMELVEGGDLGTLMSKGPLEIERALELADAILSALEQAHAAGVVHRDLKPGNVMITRGGLLKLLDFGLAKILDGSGRFDSSTTQLTLDGMVMGTLPYLAPEQLQGDPVDPRADLFSLGMLLYEMLVGQPPLPSSSMVEYAKALLLQQIEPPSQKRPDVPPWLDHLVMRLIALEPDERFESAGAARQEIARRLEPRPMRSVRGWRNLAAAALLGALCVGTAALSIWWWQNRPLTNPRDALRLGAAALREGELEDAQRLLSRAVELDVENPQSWYLLGEVYRLRGRTEFAIASYDQARKIHDDRLDRAPDSAVDLAWWSLYQAKRGRCTTALERAQDIAPRDVTSAEVLVTLARVHAVCGNADRVPSLLERARALGAEREALYAPELGTGLQIPP